jgi:hypothetical protein
MRAGFSAAIAASLAGLLFSSAAMSQTSQCDQIRADLNSAQQSLNSAQSSLQALDYDNQKDILRYNLDVALAYCNTVDGTFASECSIDAEVFYLEELQNLDDEKSRLEGEVSIYDSIVQDLQVRFFDTGCF